MFAAMSTDVKALIVGVSIPVVAVFVCAIAIMLIASIKRLHDLGRSGWFYLIGLIPVVGALWILYYSLMPGKEDDNVYGMRREATKVDKVVGIIGIVLVAIINVASLAIL